MILPSLTCCGRVFPAESCYYMPCLATSNFYRSWILIFYSIITSNRKYRYMFLLLSSYSIMNCYSWYFFHYKASSCCCCIMQSLHMIPFFISLGTCSLLFGALVAPVCFELAPLLLWFYFIWGPCCSCLFWIRALVAWMVWCSPQTFACSVASFFL